MSAARRRRAGGLTGGVLCAILVGWSAPGASAPRDQAAQPAQPPAWKEAPVQPGTYREQPTPPRADTVDVPVAANGGEIEYMVNMKQGETMVYSWRVADAGDVTRLTSEFHGHTDRAPGTTGTLVFYRKATGTSENGSLVAPFDGTHGWYFKNDTARPVVVRLTLSGFYTLVPKQAGK